MCWPGASEMVVGGILRAVCNELIDYYFKKIQGMPAFSVALKGKNLTLFCTVESTTFSSVYVSSNNREFCFEVSYPSLDYHILSTLWVVVFG